MTNLPIEDIIRLIPIPLICIMGMITNGLNTAVFLNSKMKNTTFKFMLAISINDFFYLLSCVFITIAFCENCSSIRNSYFYSLYLLIVANILGPGLAMFTIFTDIILSIHRFYIITNKKHWIWTKPKWILFITFLISIIFYLPVSFLKIINPDKNILEFTHTLSEYVYLSIHIIRFILSVIVLAILNIVNFYKYKSMNYKKLGIMKRLTLDANQRFSIGNNFKKIKLNRRMSLMVITICIISIIGNFPYFLHKIFETNLIIKIDWIKYLELFALSVLFLSRSVSIFVYFYYNKMFYSILIKYFCKNCSNKISVY